MSSSVCISGLGVASGAGVGAGALWEHLCAGRSALRRIGSLDPSGFRARCAGEVPELNIRDMVPKHYRKAVKVMSRDVQLAVAAAREAFAHAGLSTRADEGEPTLPGARVGCHIGAGLIAAETPELAPALASAADGDGSVSLKLWGGVEGGGMQALQPLWLLKYLPNMLACHVSIIHGCEGPSNTITCAQASGLLSVGESVRAIQRGAADACIAGGAESRINHLGLARLSVAGWLADTGDAEDGDAFVRPYDDATPGTVLGEAGALLIVESESSVAARGGRSLAGIAGLGAGQAMDAQIPPVDYAEAVGGDGGLVLAIRTSLDRAGIGPDQIDAIVPQGAGIVRFDSGERAALRAIFGDRLASIPLITITPVVGLTMAASSAMGLAVGAMCLERQALPAHVLLGGTVMASRGAGLRHVLVCSGSLGGQSAACVLARAGAS